jgi:hypothetical protein
MTMKLTHKLALAAIPLSLAPLSLLAAPAAAHHSYSMFDMNKTVLLDARVVQFRWQNPHAFIRVEVPVGSEVETWSIEMTSPNNLVQEGWTRTAIRQGDKVKLYVHPLRSGDRGGAYAGIVLPDGRTLGTVEE